MHEVQRRGPLPDVVLRPGTVDEVVELLAEYGERAKLIAGGTDLILEFAHLQHGAVEALIDLSGISDADNISIGTDSITIGMLVTHNQIIARPEMWESARPLAEACFEIGSPQLRNRATVVGNLATASPANDTISALRVLDASVSLRSVRGERSVRLADFHTGVRQSTCQADELITAVTFRKLGADERGVFVKAGLRAAQAISVVHAALVVATKDSIVTSARIALGSVATTIVETPVDALIGRRLEEKAIAETALAASAAVTPIDDVRATAAYRSEAVRIVVERGLRSLIGSHPIPRRPILLGASGTTHGHRGSDVVVNGHGLAVEGGAGLTLLDWLRDVAGPAIGTSLTGTKEGCAEGECGACTVQLNGSSVMSCLVPASSVGGSSVVTVEGIGNGALHPVQQAFIDKFAVQCGYCIPGFIVAGASLLDEVSSPDADAVVEGLAGNLCRCTGYYKIIDAVVEAGS